MKKLLTLTLIMIFGIISGNIFGQEKKTQEKKGGFAVGGYDNSRQAEKPAVTKRSVIIDEEAAPAEKAAEEVMPAPAPAPAPSAAEAKPQKDAQGNAYGKDKDGLEGKDFGQARSQDAKAKQKPKKEKSKGKRR